MLEGSVLIATLFKSLLGELWPSSVLHNSKFRVPGKVTTPVITTAFLFISSCVPSSVNSHWESTVHSEWRASEFATLSCTALGERVGGI